MKEAKMKVTLVQAYLAWENPEENLARFEERLKEIKETDLIILPEMFTSGFTMTGKERIAPFYEETCSKLSVWARKKQVLIMGSVIFFEEGKYYNRLLVAFPDGKINWYDKRHCFTMGGEHTHFTPGNKRLIIEYKGVKIAPFICYDLRFPVWSRNVEEYDVAIYVANWPAVRRDPWEILLRARAVENQCYVVGVNCVGEDGNGLRYSGDSTVISPKGEVVLACEAYQEEIRQIDLDLSELWEFRKKFPVLEDRDQFSIETK